MKMLSYDDSSLGYSILLYLVLLKIVYNKINIVIY